MVLKRLIIALIFIHISFLVSAQERIEFKNSTPRETVESHLNFLKPNNYKPTIAAYTLGGNKTIQQKKVLVSKLKDIILKHGINLNDIPNKKGGLFGKKKYILFNDIPLIYLVRINKKWVYSPETVDNINKIFKSYFIGVKSQKIPSVNEILLSNNKKWVNETNDKQKNNTTSHNNISKKSKTQGAKQSKEEQVISDSTLENKNDNNITELNLSTPYNTIISHLLFLSDTLYNPYLASKTINFGPADTANAIDLAIKLYQIYLGADVEVFNINELSTDSNYVDSISKKHIYIPNKKFKELYLEKIGDNWYYSRATSELINSVHRDMYSNDAEEIFSFSDHFKALAGNNNTKYIFDLKLWQIYMVLFFLIIFLFLFVVNIFIKFVIKKYIKNDAYSKAIIKIIRSFIYIMYFVTLQQYVPSLKINVDYIHLIHKAISILTILFGTILSLNVINLARIITTKDSINSTAGIVIFVTLLIKTIVIIAGALLIIKELEYNLINVLAGLSIGGLALALGAQDTIKNFFGSVMIFTDKPFSVGDYIVNDEIRGTVEEVGLRTTKIRTPLNSVATIPNGRLADNNIDNLGRRKFRRYKSKFSVSYDTPIEKIDELTLRATEIINNIDTTKDDVTRIYMNDFGVYGIEIFISISFDVNNRKEELENRHIVIKEILKLCKELEIKIAVGIQSEIIN